MTGRRTVLMLPVLSFLCLLSTSSAIMAEETLVAFPSANGDGIKGIYVPPSGRQPAPAIIVMHGCAGLFTKSGKMRKRERAWTGAFQREGWAVLVVDSFAARGHEGSLCKVKDRPVDPGKHRQHDALGALIYLNTRTEIDPSRIVLAGWSNGAMSTLHAIRDGGPATPHADLIDFVAAVAFYPGCTYIRKRYPAYKSRIPTLIQHGSADDWTLAAPCAEMVRINQETAGAGMEIDIYEGAYHNFDHPDASVRLVETRSSSSPTGLRAVHIGSDPVARALAIERTLRWLRVRLKG